MQLKEVIWDRLEQERASIEAHQKQHQEDIANAMVGNNSRKDEMKAKLMKLLPDSAN